MDLRGAVHEGRGLSAAAALGDRLSKEVVHDSFEACGDVAVHQYLVLPDDQQLHYQLEYRRSERHQRDQVGTENHDEGRQKSLSNEILTPRVHCSLFTVTLFLRHDVILLYKRYVLRRRQDQH